MISVPVPVPPSLFSLHTVCFYSCGRLQKIRMLQPEAESFVHHVLCQAGYAWSTPFTCKTPNNCRTNTSRAP